MSDPEHSNWIVILVCDNIPNQKFWDGKDWTTDLEKAKIHPTYGDSARAIWYDITEEQFAQAEKEARKKYPNIAIRITSSPIASYRKLLVEHARSGKKS